jgi:hypothetical protein
MFKCPYFNNVEVLGLLDFGLWKSSFKISHFTKKKKEKNIVALWRGRWPCGDFLDF